MFVFHIINGKPFWNDKLQTLKEEKDLARDRSDSSGLLEDCISLRKKQAILKKEILNAKRASFNKFLTTERMDQKLSDSFLL
ncbi:hypothetical protein TNCV_2978611 [Trichonephila clavipes]|nr:hypothetical protein TNCV_2978611 [Trichonephila clavipes]